MTKTDDGCTVLHRRGCYQYVKRDDGVRFYRKVRGHGSGKSKGKKR